jgi:hypothetical protein
MKYRWTLLPVLSFLWASQARAAAVAVMPVEGVNLTEGQCDVVGLLFSNAFARELRMHVAQPQETKPIFARTKSAPATAAELGATEYVQLRALQLGARVTVAGIRYTKDGAEIFRAETAASSLDDIEAAAARLARALAWRQPIAGATYAAPAPPPVGEPGPELSGPVQSQYPKALGIKTGLVFPVASGKSFAPLMSLQFDGRIGSRDSFVEFGIGAAIPSSTGEGSKNIQMGGVFAELGGSYYLSSAPVAPYLGAGVSPRIWIADAPNVSDGAGATCTVYGQAGITFTRDSRVRIFGELRVNQYIIGLIDNARMGATYYPTEFALQIGMGW